MTEDNKGANLREMMIAAGVPEADAQLAADLLGTTMYALLARYEGGGPLRIPVVVPDDPRGGFDVALSWRSDRGEDLTGIGDGAAALDDQTIRRVSAVAHRLPQSSAEVVRQLLATIERDRA